MGVTDSLCFGVESGDAATYRNAARAMLSETKEFRQALKRELETGVSLAKAKFNAVKKLDLPDLDESIVSSPNKHSRAGISPRPRCKWQADLELYPFLRENIHNDVKLQKYITSAQSIRAQLREGKKKKIKKYLPKYVYEDLPDLPPDFRPAVMAALVSPPRPKSWKRSSDCTEGLENPHQGASERQPFV